MIILFVMNTLYEEMDYNEYNNHIKNTRYRYYFKTTLEIIRTLSVFIIAIILIITIGYIYSHHSMIENFINNGTHVFSSANNIINTYNPIIKGTLDNFNNIGSNFNITLEYVNKYIIEEKLVQIFNDIEVLINHADYTIINIKNNSNLMLKYLDTIQQELKELIE